MKFLATALLAASAVIASTAQSQSLEVPRYRVTPIAPGADIDVFDLNNRGEIVGTIYLINSSSLFETHAFRWQNGNLTDLNHVVSPDPSERYTTANGVNDRGDIVGTTSEGVYVLRGQQVAPLHAVPGETSVYPIDINDRGQVILDSFGGEVTGSFIVDGTTVERLPDLPGGSHTMHAFALSDRGAVTGYTDAYTAVLWRAGVLQALPKLSGWGETRGWDVNDRNTVAGFADINGQRHAVIWRGGNPILLPNWDDTDPYSNAEGVNDFGIVVGEIGDSAALWFRNRAYKLDDLVRDDDPFKNVHFTAAYKINNRGDIVASANGGRSKYFLTLLGQ